VIAAQARLMGVFEGIGGKILVVVAREGEAGIKPGDEIYELSSVEDPALVRSVLWWLLDERRLVLDADLRICLPEGT